MHGIADSAPSAPPDLLDKALQDAFEAGYNQGIKDALNSVQKLLDSSTNNSTPVVAIVGRQQSWPKMSNRLVSFNDKEMEFRGDNYAKLFQRLLEARGGIVAQADLREFYGSKAALHSAVCRIRPMLVANIPEIGIETIGDGYRMVIHD